MYDPKYQAFLKIAETGSIKKSAELLGYTQTGISYLINTLEEELNIKLFIRNYGGTLLTSEGAAILPYIKSIINIENDLYNKIHELRNLDSGILRIGAISSVHISLLPQILKEYSSRHPGIEIRLKCYDDDKKLEAMVLSDELDCVFFIAPAKGKLETMDIYEDPIVVILPPDNPYADKKSFPVSQLCAFPYIDSEIGPTPEVDAIFAKHGIRPNIAYSLNSDFGVISMVSNGFGISLFPELMLKNVASPLIKKPLSIPASRKISLAIRSKATASSAAAQFIETVLHTSL